MSNFWTWNRAEGLNNTSDKTGGTRTGPILTGNLLYQINRRHVIPELIDGVKLRPEEYIFGSERTIGNPEYKMSLSKSFSKLITIRIAQSRKIMGLVASYS